jgi:hypothetical protein
MFDFDYMLKQMDDRIEKNSKKIQALALRIIPLEEEKERIEKARQVLAGEIPIKIPQGGITSSILEYIKNNGPVKSLEVARYCGKNGISENTARSLLFSLHKNNRIKKNTIFNRRNILWKQKLVII